MWLDLERILLNTTVVYSSNYIYLYKKVPCYRFDIKNDRSKSITRYFIPEVWFEIQLRYVS